MNSTNNFSLVALMTVAAFVTSAKADVLYYDNSAEQAHTHYYQFYDEATDFSAWKYASPFKANSDNLDGDSFRVFCVDQHTVTSSDFASTGQVYHSAALNSESMTLYSQMQKDALNSLFSHVYSTVFDNNGDFIDSSSVASYVYQLAVWEIIHEQSGVYAVDNGTFGVTAAATCSSTGSASYDSGFYYEAVGLANSWLDAIAGDITWESIGLGEVTEHELTIYVADGGTDVSQTLISVVNTEPSATPEPASMLIFGLGIAGLGFARRRMIVK